MENEEKVIQDPNIEELKEKDEVPPEYQLESMRQEAGLGKITPEMRRELYNRFLEFETQLGTCTPQQQTFILAYLRDPTSAYKAGLVAGYSEASVRPYVSRLMANPKIANIIALGNNIREDRTFITADRTLQELALIAYSDITDYVIHPEDGQLQTREGVPDINTRAVASAEFTTVVDDRGEGRITTTFKTKLKMWNKVDALRMLALYQKLVKSDGSSVTINNQSEAGSQTMWVFGDKEIVLG